MSHKPVKYAKPCKKRPDASIRKVFLDAIRQSHGIHPPSEITDIVFTNHRERLLRLIQVCEHFIFDATANSFMNPGATPLELPELLLFGEPSVLTLQKLFVLPALTERSHQFAGSFSRM